MSSGGLLRLIASNHASHTLQMKKNGLVRGNVASLYQNINCLQDQYNKHKYTVVIHRNLDVIDHLWLIVTIPGYQEYDFSSLFDVIETVQLQMNDKIIDTLTGKLIETYLLLEDPIAYKTYSRTHGSTNEVRIPLPFMGKIKSKLTGIYPCLYYVSYTVIITLTDSKTWPIRMIRNLHEFKANPNNLLSLLPTFVIDKHISPYLDKQFAGTLNLFLGGVYLDSPARRLFATNNFKHPIVHHTILEPFNMRNGQVNKTTIYLNGMPHTIFIRIEAKGYQFEDLIEAKFCGNGHDDMIVINPMISQINCIKRGIYPSDQPIYVIDFEEELFSFGRIDNVTFELKSKSQLNGKVNMWISNHNSLSNNGLELSN